MGTLVTDSMHKSAKLAIACTRPQLQEQTNRLTGLAPLSALSMTESNGTLQVDVATECRHHANSAANESPLACDVLELSQSQLAHLAGQTQPCRSNLRLCSVAGKRRKHSRYFAFKDVTTNGCSDPSFLHISLPALCCLTASHGNSATTPAIPTARPPFMSFRIRPPTGSPVVWCLFNSSHTAACMSDLDRFCGSSHTLPSGHFSSCIRNMNRSPTRMSCACSRGSTGVSFGGAKLLTISSWTHIS